MGPGSGHPNRGNRWPRNDKTPIFQNKPESKKPIRKEKLATRNKEEGKKLIGKQGKGKGKGEGGGLGGGLWCGVVWDCNVLYR